MEKFNEALLEIWRKAEPGPLTSRLPLFRSPLKPGCLLFIGINPSFSDIGFKKYMDPDFDPHTFYQFPPTVPIDFDRCLDIEKKAAADHPYFKRFGEIAETLKLDWDHLDLLSIRETNQASIRNAISDQKGNLIPFAENQLKLVEELLLNSAPVAIVVANAFASRIFENRFSPDFDQEAGCHRLTVRTRPVPVPVFFTSMLTGQRALDTFSYKRLIWHLAFALGKTPN